MLAIPPDLARLYDSLVNAEGRGGAAAALLPQAAALLLGFLSEIQLGANGSMECSGLRREAAEQEPV